MKVTDRGQILRLGEFFDVEKLVSCLDRGDRIWIFRSIPEVKSESELTMEEKAICIMERWKIRHEFCRVTVFVRPK